MPNWCYNRVIVDGDPKEVRRLARVVCSRRSVFSLNAVIPLKKFEYPESAWGTKWEAQDAIVTEIEPLTYEFDTAWTPPVYVCIELRRRFPHLNTSWYFLEFLGCWQGYL